MKLTENEGIRKALASFVNCIWLGVLWLACSLPVVTLGASSVALYYAVVKGVRHDRGTPTKLFFSAFRDNFKTATITWLICAAFLAVVTADIVILRGSELRGTWLYICSWLLLIPVGLELSWIFAYISRFQNSVIGGIRFSLFFALQQLGRTLLILLLYAATVLLTLLWAPFALILPGLVCLACSYLVEPAFRPLTEALGESAAWYNE